MSIVKLSEQCSGEELKGLAKVFQDFKNVKVSEDHPLFGKLKVNPDHPLQMLARFDHNDWAAKMDRHKKIVGGYL